MELWTVYDQNAAFPGRCAVRRVQVRSDGLFPSDWKLYRCIEEARGELARKGLIAVPRAATDEPGLYETWL